MDISITDWFNCFVRLVCWCRRPVSTSCSLFLFIDLVHVEVAFFIFYFFLHTSVILYLYGDYMQHPVLWLYCMCCFGVNCNGVIRKALFQRSDLFQWSKSTMQLIIKKWLFICFIREKITPNTTTDFCK